MTKEKETKTCQNCRNSFVIEPEDFNFYEKIKVPPPTFCPECRRQRRMTFRNERTLYKRKCNAPGHDEDIISVYSADKPFVVYDEKYWWSDNWDPLSYGRDYDFSKPFFQQYRELLERVPLIALSVTNMVNSSYCNVSNDDKNCYLISASEEDENVRYSNRVVYSKDSQDIYIGDHHELCYDITNSTHCYDCKYCLKCNQCWNSVFCFDCANCDNCFMCSNLKNKSYHIFNKPYSKEEYKKKLTEFNLGNYSVIEDLRNKFDEMRHNALHRYAYNYKSSDVTGDNIVNAKNMHQCFDIVGPAEDCRFMVWGGVNAKDIYDGGPGIGISAELVYEAFDSGIKASRLFFTGVVYGSTDIYYSLNCHSSKNLFGCYGVRGGEYCILNKKYSREEYENLVPRIAEHMNKMPYADSKGRIYKYGEFFPIEISPFSYNESIAQDYHPITKENAASNGYQWKDPSERNYQITKKPEDLPDNIKDIPDSIVNEIIGCAHEGKCNEECTTAFKIIPDEFTFYKHMNIPLPRLCFNCRHARRLKMRNPLKLWHRKCQCAGKKSEIRNKKLETGYAYENTIAHFHGNEPCPNEFETSYPPESPAIVYCEQCYQSEVI